MGRSRLSAADRDKRFIVERTDTRSRNMMLLEIAASVHLVDLKSMVTSDGWSVPKGWGPLVEIQF